MLNKETIVKLLETDQRAIARALVVLTARQTADEQSSENTRYLNGRGFRPCHARMGTSMAKFFARTGYLTPKQIAYWRGRDKTGAMRIGIYWAQLLEEAEAKAKKFPGLTRAGQDLAALKVAALERDNYKELHAARDYGNDMERRMLLVEFHGDMEDSDDPAILGPIETEIAEIDAFWARVRNSTPNSY